MIDIGFASRELRFGAPILQGGFAARTTDTDVTHDPLEARAVAIGETCLIVVDATAVDAELCDEIAALIGIPRAQVVVTATHTHSGPAFVRGGIGDATLAFRDYVAERAAAAGLAARAARRPREVGYGDAGALPFATDRRRGGRPDAARLQVLHWSAAADAPEGWLLLYPCHPTVLGPDNVQLSADYPGAVRAALSEGRSGADVIFATGCAGDVNAGHKVTDSYAATASNVRTFAEVERLGALISDAALSASLTPLADSTTAAVRRELGLPYEALDPLDGPGLVDTWRSWMAEASDAEGAVYSAWIDWARRPDAGTSGVLPGSVTAFRWGELSAVFLPGEPFLAAAVALGAELGPGAVMAFGYANGCPGYLPSADAYDDGGYEVEDAHRYYGVPAPFRRGTAEAVVAEAVLAARAARGSTPTNQ